MNHRVKLNFSIQLFSQSVNFGPLFIAPLSVKSSGNIRLFDLLPGSFH
jgi:hypothetical protein